MTQASLYLTTMPALHNPSSSFSLDSNTDHSPESHDVLESSSPGSSNIMQFLAWVKVIALGYELPRDRGLLVSVSQCLAWYLVQGTNTGNV